MNIDHSYNRFYKYFSSFCVYTYVVNCGNIEIIWQNDKRFTLNGSTAFDSWLCGSFTLSVSHKFRFHYFLEIFSSWIISKLLMWAMRYPNILIFSVERSWHSIRSFYKNSVNHRILSYSKYWTPIMMSRT